MAEPAAGAPEARAVPPADPLAALGRAGVVTHAVRFDADLAGVARLSDEARVLEALAAVVEGQIFRLAPLDYAVRLAGDGAAGAALAAALAERLGVDAATVTRVASAPAPHEDAAALLAAFAADPAPQTRVIDAQAAVAAAERAAERIGELAAQAHGRLQIEREDLAGRLDRIEAALAAASPAADEALRDALARIEAAQSAAPAADPAEEGLAAALARIEATLAASPEPAAAPQTAPGDDRLGDVLAQVAAAAEAAAQSAASGRDLAARLARVEAALAARPEPAPADATLRDALARIEATLAAAPRPDPAEDRLQDLLARIEAATRQPDHELLARLERMERALDALATPAADRAAADEPASRLEAIEATLQTLAERAAPTPDLRAEREAFGRALFGLQTAVARMEAEFARIRETDELLAPVAHRLDIVAKRLAGALTAAEEGGAALAAARAAAEDVAAAAAGLARIATVTREEAEALRAERAAAGERGGAAIALDQPTAERIGAMLAEYLAQSQRSAALGQTAAGRVS